MHATLAHVDVDCLLRSYLLSPGVCCVIPSSAGTGDICEQPGGFAPAPLLVISLRRTTTLFPGVLLRPA